MPSQDAKTEEKSPIIARHVSSAPNSGVHTSPFVRYLSTCICSLGHIRCHRSEHHDAKWVQTTLVNLFHTTYPKSPSYRDSRQPRLSSPREAEGVPPLYPWSFVSSQFGPTSQGHAQLSGFAWDTKKQISDLPVLIRVFAQDCLNARACDAEWLTARCNCECSPPPSSIKEQLYWTRTTVSLETYLSLQTARVTAASRAFSHIILDLDSRTGTVQVRND